MVSIVRCLLRNCFEQQNDNESDDENSSTSSTREQRVAAFFPSSGIRAFYLRPEDAHGADGVLMPSDRCHAEEDSSVSTAADPSIAETLSSSPHTPSHDTPVMSFLSRLGIGTREDSKQGRSPTFLPLGSLQDSPPSTPRTSLSSPPPNINALSNTELRTQKLATLKEAITFDYNTDQDLPAIHVDEFVMPGSDIQKKMALSMTKNLKAQEDECVICMDTFSYENPRMPTLCGCGENKTYFHLPCLYQWIEQNRNCPSCRKRLRWEEF